MQCAFCCGVLNVWNLSHFKTLQSSDTHHVISCLWNDAHHFQRSLQILRVLTSTLRVLQNILEHDWTSLNSSIPQFHNRQKQQSINRGWTDYPPTLRIKLSLDRFYLQSVLTILMERRQLNINSYSVQNSQQMHFKTVGQSDGIPSLFKTSATAIHLMGSS